MSATTDKIEQEITDQIIAMLEAGDLPPWQRPWVRGGSFNPIPVNFKTGNVYHGSNIIRLWATAERRGYATNQWLTTKQARALGGRLIEGEYEKSASCFFMLPRLVEDKKRPGEKTLRFSAQPFWVYNTSQFEGLDVPVIEEPDFEGKTIGVAPAEFDTCALREVGQAAVDKTGLEIHYGGPRAFYRESSDQVWMPDGFAQEGHYEGFACVLSHELVHATGHSKRLGRFKKTQKKGGIFGDPVYAFEELVAELGAVFLCAQLGIPIEIEQNAAYLKSWLRGFKSHRTFLTRAAKEASEAASYLARGSVLPDYMLKDQKAGKLAA